MDNKILSIGDKYHGASVCPERGGIITSLRLPGQDGGREILYMDLGTFNDPTKNVRGGIPLMFPNAGPVESRDFPNLPQHGIARKSAGWKGSLRCQRTFEETLDSGSLSKEHSEAYPFQFKLNIMATLLRNSSTQISMSVFNSGSQPLPIAMGLHPYHPIPAKKKGQIRFLFPEGDRARRSVQHWSSGGTLEIPNPMHRPKPEPIVLDIPDLGILEIHPSAIFKWLWLWSPSDSDFFCLSFAMRSEGGLIDYPHMILPKKWFDGLIRYKLIDKFS